MAKGVRGCEWVGETRAPGRGNSLCQVLKTRPKSWQEAEPHRTDGDSQRAKDGNRKPQKARKHRSMLPPVWVWGWEKIGRISFSAHSRLMTAGDTSTTPPWSGIHKPPKCQQSPGTLPNLGKNRTFHVPSHSSPSPRRHGQCPAPAIQLHGAFTSVWQGHVALVSQLHHFPERTANSGTSPTVPVSDSAHPLTSLLRKEKNVEATPEALFPASTRVPTSPTECRSVQWEKSGLRSFKDQCMNLISITYCEVASTSASVKWGWYHLLTRLSQEDKRDDV